MLWQCAHLCRAKTLQIFLQLHGWNDKKSELILLSTSKVREEAVFFILCSKHIPTVLQRDYSLLQHNDDILYQRSREIKLFCVSFNWWSILRLGVGRTLIKQPLSNVTTSPWIRPASCNALSPQLRVYMKKVVSWYTLSYSRQNGLSTELCSTILPHHSARSFPRTKPVWSAAKPVNYWVRGRMKDSDYSISIDRKFFTRLQPVQTT